MSRNHSKHIKSGASFLQSNSSKVPRSKLINTGNHRDSSSISFKSNMNNKSRLILQKPFLEEFWLIASEILNKDIDKKLALLVDPQDLYSNELKGDLPEIAGIKLKKVKE